MTREEALYIRSVIEKAAASLDDNTALTATMLFPAWTPGQTYTAGHRLLYGDTLYRVLQDHTSQTDWTPDSTPALYTVVEAVHSGSADDPIPYNGNMELVEGLYYTQGGVLYRCIRSTGQPVYHALPDLVGIYVEVVTTGGNSLPEK